MTAADTIRTLQTEFGPAVLAANADALDPFVVVAPAKLAEVAAFLRDDPRMNFAVLNDVTGVDYLETDPKKLAKAGFEPHLEVVYHVSSFAVPGRRFTFKVTLPRENTPDLPTLYKVWATADWQEREVYDLFGIVFAGHPDLRRILLADDWVGHPLRKDYEYPDEYHGIRCK
jgi:NADH-quinone oxidoreductase subunit C